MFTNPILPILADVYVERRECFSRITWTVQTQDPLVSGVEIERRITDGGWQQICVTTHDSFVDVFDIIAPEYQYRARLYGKDDLFSDWVIAVVKPPDPSPLPDPIAKTEVNYWRAQYFQALRELTNANKGIRRLKTKCDRLTQAKNDI